LQNQYIQNTWKFNTNFLISKSYSGLKIIKIHKYNFIY